MTQKYIIIGGGPSGLCLAFFLARSGKVVELYEKDDIGGSWKSNWEEGKYWVENAARVLSYKGNTRYFLTEIGIKHSDLQDVYGNFWTTQLKMVTFIKKYFSLFDLFIYVKSAILYLSFPSRMTVSDWFEQSNFSESAKNALRTVCITINDLPENTNLSDFLGYLTKPYLNLKQFRDSNAWHRLILDKLQKLSNFKLITNFRAQSLLELDGKVYAMTGIQNKTPQVQKITGHRFFLCTQSEGLLPIIQQSSKELQDNWWDFNTFTQWCRNTYYSGFGFQLHFIEKIEAPSEWCWSCNNDWTIIVLPVSAWLDEYSKDAYIQTVWSCTITDLNSVSNYTKKTVNQCTREEVAIEGFRQIQESYKCMPSPANCTFAPGLKKVDGKWKSKYTGFTQKNLGKLAMKGKLENLFALGCFTETKTLEVASMETAITASLEYIRLYERDIPLPPKTNYFTYIVVLCICYLMWHFSFR